MSNLISFGATRGVDANTLVMVNSRSATTASSSQSNTSFTAYGVPLYMPAQAPNPFADKAAVDTWASVNRTELYQGQTALRVENGGLSSWLIWQGLSKPASYTPNSWVDGTPLIQGQAGIVNLNTSFPVTPLDTYAPSTKLVSDNFDATNAVVSTHDTDISTLQAEMITANMNIANKIDVSEKGVANGVAPLDSSGKIDSQYIPGSYDNVQSYPTLAAFPAVGIDNVIYLAIDTNLSYRWNGSGYSNLDPSLALGETASTAYAGNKGKDNADSILALQTDLGEKIDNAEKGVANGVATLDVDSMIPESQYIKGTLERITAVMQVNQTVTSEAILLFDPALSQNENGLSVDSAGSIVCMVDGYYNVLFSSYIVEAGNPVVSVWAEKKPNGASVWEVLPASLSQKYIRDDGASALMVGGNLNLLAGDELRIKALSSSGTTVFTTIQLPVTLGTVTQYAATLAIFRIGKIL